MHFPPEPWKKLADLCHLHPEKDFPQCTWFLPFCFGKAVPEGCIVAESLQMNGDDISEVVMTTDIDYSIVRKWHKSLNVPAKERIARYSKLDTILW